MFGYDYECVRLRVSEATAEYGGKPIANFLLWGMRILTKRSLFNKRRSGVSYSY